VSGDKRGCGCGDDTGKIGFGCTGCLGDIEEIGEDEINENIYLDCIPWDQSEKSLPAGIKTLIPRFSAINLVRVWEVLDVDTDDGFRLVKPRDLQPDDILIGAQMSEPAFKKICEGYGNDALLFRRADTGKLLTRASWVGNYGMDPLELQALKEGRQRGDRND